MFYQMFLIISCDILKYDYQGQHDKIRAAVEKELKKIKDISSSNSFKWKFSFIHLPIFFFGPGI